MCPPLGLPGLPDLPNLPLSQCHTFFRNFAIAQRTPLRTSSRRTGSTNFSRNIPDAAASTGPRNGIKQMPISMPVVKAQAIPSTNTSSQLISVNLVLYVVATTLLTTPRKSPLQMNLKYRPLYNSKNPIRFCAVEHTRCSLKGFARMPRQELLTVQ